MKPLFIEKIKIQVPEEDIFPYNIPLLKNGIDLTLDKSITFIVGENGSGKSTLLEAIAEKCEFNLAGGNKNHVFEHYKTEASLYDHTTITWVKKVSDGFFLRAETFYNFAEYIDSSNFIDAYGNKSLHKQSHGESFLSLFKYKFKQGLFILDEPEAALSPMRLMALMIIINDLLKTGKVQFIIATHSPILLTFPNSTIYEIQDGKLSETNYESTEHFKVTKNFLNDPNIFLKNLV
jgi:predicted ATPase